MLAGTALLAAVLAVLILPRVRGFATATGAGSMLAGTAVGEVGATPTEDGSDAGGGAAATLPTPTDQAEPTFIPTAAPPTSSPVPPATPTDVPAEAPAPTLVPTEIPHPTATEVVVDPREEAQQVVMTFFQAINDRDYELAYSQLSAGFQERQPYESFEAGFAETARDDVFISAVEPREDGSYAIYVDLAAYQTDGSVKRFTGPYFVGQEGGVWKILGARLTEGG